MALAWPAQSWLRLLLLVFALAGRPHAKSTDYYPDQEPKEPNLANIDATMCDKIYGDNLDEDACSTAIYKMPIGDDLFDFTIPHAGDTVPPHSRAVFVPEVYTDAGYQEQPRCTVTVDIAGGAPGSSLLHTNNEVVAMAMDIFNKCLHSSGGVGGLATRGLPSVVNSIVDRGVQTPIPAFLTVKITGPTDRSGTGDTILGISQKVQEGLWAWWAVLTSPNESAMRLEVAASIQYLATRSQDMMLNNEGGNWYDQPSDWRVDTSAAVPVPNNVKYSCSATLGSPSAPNCEAALYEMQNSGNVLLDPKSGPIIHVAGNCAVAISATRQRYTKWDVIKSATLMLMSQCVADPLSLHVGGVATAQVAHAKGGGPFGARARPAVLALGVQIAIYFQDAFTGPAKDTCAYGVISNHTGDVGQCHG